MNLLREIYRTPLALLTDLYELTMAQGYWKLDRRDEQAAFHLTFRDCPFGGGYAIACGLAFVIDFLDALAFEEADLGYLATQRAADGTPLFEPAFLDHLRRLRLTLDLDAMPEGTAVFPHEPLVRATGPILDCQIIESALLNMVNFQTLVATKSSRVCQAAHGEPVIEFGLRRAQGIDGALAASRAAYVGGCAGTSNVLAGRLFGIPVKGTHAHSWVMSFATEREAFAAYARAMPNNCLFLVDTYDTLEGVRRAIEVARDLRREGHELLGIRLDSGDLAYLSTAARRMLDEAGFRGAAIVASNDLDEHVIEALKEQDAAVNVWGVGTRLVTGHGQGALGGVYKLSAVRFPGQDWQRRVKVSEETDKVSIPGRLQVRRFRRDGMFAADMIYEESLGAPETPTIVDPVDSTRRKRLEADMGFEDLLVPVFRGGKRVYEPPPPGDARRRADEQLAALHEGVRRFLNPHRYPAGIEKGLHDLRTELILAARGAER